MTVIDLELIEAGDLLTVQDQDKNVAQGAAVVTDDQLLIHAFGVLIPCARTNRNGRLVPVTDVRLVGHQPTLQEFLL